VKAPLARSKQLHGAVKGIAPYGDDGRVCIALRLTSPVCEMVGYMRKEAMAKVGAILGVSEVSVGHDSRLDWDHDLIAPAAQARRERSLAMLREVRTAALAQSAAQSASSGA
jgi:hypothetical protein